MFITIAACFNLKLKQYNTVNVFVHAPLKDTVFMRMPPGRWAPGQIFRLNKALYGLQKSPLLWQQLFTEKLQSLGFEAIPHKPCCFTKNGILLFYYVDDIVLAYRKSNEHKALDVIDQLREKKLNISGGEDLQWFLGIEVIQDQSQWRIWLSQASYIDKISWLVELSTPDEMPMKNEELFYYKQEASKESIHWYQWKIGSLLYAAVTTQPDISFTVSRLSHFMTNPSPRHHKSADRVFNYLKRYQYLSLCYGGEDDFVVASDTSFADNSEDRKSSQAYIMRLFGGVISWQANKQNTITTSTTEAELLALSQAAKEGLYIGRLLKELMVELDEHGIQILCDNQQTIWLVTEDIACLQTKLRHVDIHNHWLCQEVQQKWVQIEYTPTGDMIVNGLTKVLPQGQFGQFFEQLGMEDLETVIHQHWEAELSEEGWQLDEFFVDEDTDLWADSASPCGSAGGVCWIE